MKKEIGLAVLLMTAMAVLLCACGKKSDNVSDNTVDEFDLSSVDPDEYVKLGDYKNLSTEVTYVTFTEEELQECIDNELGYYVEAYDLYNYEPDVSANTVADGSVVNIDYEGKIDGEVFEGGSAQGAHLVIGSGSFIEGFESGLVGKAVGDTTELNLAFPEDYQNAEHAGKDVVFTVTINAIEKRSMPAYDDEFIAALNLGEGITTYDAYVEYLRQYLQDTCDSQNETTLQEAVWSVVYAACEVNDPPQEMTDMMYEDLKEYFESYAQYYNMDFETFVTTQMSMDMEAFETKNLEAAKEEAKKELAYMAIAKAEDIKVDDALMEEVAESEYADYGYQSADELISTMGKNDFYSYVMRKKVMERLSEIVQITENPSVSLLESAMQQ